ncbi:MAG: tripartite tricarboxylate transporter substrate binding protein [Alphaproteobacteria bacterium]|nr:tripartite tricarboxylate transporter substrate binding protein [Alphaproteobacteria bacterium]
MFSRRVICLALTAAAVSFGLTVSPAATFAQSQKTKMIVPYGKGGGSDQLSRAMAKSVESVSKTRFDIVNIKKGSGLGALPEFMKLPADGNTVIEHIDDVASAFAIGATDIHPGKDWTPLNIVQLTFSQLFIRSDDPRFNDWESFLAYAKQKEKRVAVANVSYDGSMENLTMRALEKDLGFKTRQISFPNVKDRYEAVFTGRADALFEQPGDVRKYLDSGRLKPIVTFFRSRPSAFSDVPTHFEVGAGFKPFMRFRGFFVKAGVPEERLKYLQDVFAKGYKTDSFQKFNASKYMTIIDPYRDPEGSVTLINETIESYSEAYQDFLLQTLNDYFKR